MSNTRNTGLGIMTTLRQIVDNLDAQRDQLVAAIERDYNVDEILAQTPSIEFEVGLIREHVEAVIVAKEQIHRDLVPFFTEIAHAREALVDAHNYLRDVVDPISMMRDSRR